MMPYQDVTFAEGACPTDAQLRQIFENLQEFQDCAEEASDELTCRPIPTRSQSGRLREEQCYVLQDPTNAAPADAAIEQKFLFLDIDLRGEFGANGSEFDPNRATINSTAVVRCDGVDVATIASASDFLSFACFECSTLSTVEICITPTASSSQSGFPFIQGSATTSICGAMACIGPARRTALGDFFLPEFRPGCKYGRDFIHAVLQNLNVLSSTFAESGQIPSCSVLNVADDGDQTILFNANTVTDYLVLGHIDVCLANNSNQSVARFTVQPRAQCGSRVSACNVRQFTIQPQESSTNVVNGTFPVLRAQAMSGGTCFRVPVAFCGQCQVGDNLLLGFQGRLDCEDDGGGIGGGGFQASVTSVNQHYCVFLFERFQNTLQSLPTGLPRCPSLELFQEIGNQMQQINAVCSEISGTNATKRFDSGAASSGDDLELQEALPWPPPNDPTNTQPAPLKKWWLNLRVTGCFRGNISSDNNGQSSLTGEVTVFCGDDVLFTRRASVPLLETFNTRPRCDSVQFQGCIECPIDQPIRMEFDAFRSGSEGSLVGSSFTYTYDMVCF